MRKLNVTEDQLREVLLDMSGEEIRKLYLEIKKPLVVAEILECGLDEISEALDSLDWTGWVKEVVKETWPEKTEKASSETTSDITELPISSKV